ncbi:FeoB-associated Cys-rich membrane protein [Fictibacillus sp. Mic-4]|uniref:FeoB-associated Cys-rich membrane protein n=1 Tax=Fictibacillus TaxID=1329200 RepID=UPI00042A834D|nr:FeoB-associated Cys-rich membrane protein [Fictibacillus gelatini]
MVISVVIGVLIFAYAGFTLYRFVKRSKMGKCAGCSLNKSCTTACSEVKEETIPFSARYSHATAEK